MIASGSFSTFQARADRLADSVRTLMTRAHLTVSTAESVTGGLAGATLVSVSGASNFFSGGIVAYSNESKVKLLGVRKRTLSVHGAVSSETAIEMASGARALFESSISVSCTGIAGPAGETEHKPVGLVYLAIASDGGARAVERRFEGDRTAVRLATVEGMLRLLIGAAGGSPDEHHMSS